MSNRSRLALLLTSLLAVAAIALGAASPWKVIAPAAQTPPPAAKKVPAAAPVGVAKVDAGLAARLAAMEKALDARRAELHIPGVALAIVQGDRVIYARGLGLRDAEHHLPVTAHTRFAIGSCSKVFTALLGVMAEDAGKLSLDDPPRKYLPYFKLQDPELDAAVTLRDLMSHRTGLASEDESLWWEGKLNREEVIRAGMAPAPVAKLRQEFHYNNILYSAAGEAIARAYGKSWEDLVQHRLFDPIGMTESDLSRTAMQASPDYAQGYEQPGPAGQPGPADPPAPVAMRDLTNVAPAGAVNSNARDMARFLRFMLDGGAVGGKRLVSKKRFAELSATNSMVREGTTYGLGWGCKDWKGHKTCGHNGGIDGFNTVVSIMADRDLGFVLLTNVSLSDLMKEVADIVYGNLVGDGKAAGTAH